MYSRLKTVLKFILPSFLWLKMENNLRKLYSLFFIGNQVYCSVCQKHFSKFILLENGDKLCPNCGSLPRHRRLWKIINEEIIITSSDIILHFSPERCITRKLKNFHQERYHTTEYDPTAQTQFHFDITRIDAKDQTYSYVICYHVLEHIENDRQAMSELYRILKKEGKVLIQTPFKEGDIYEDFTLTTKEDRLTHFGQDDHVRIYSVLGLKNRLESVGFQIQLKQFEDEKSEYYGFKKEEIVLVCTKI